MSEADSSIDTAKPATAQPTLEVLFDERHMEPRELADEWYTPRGSAEAFRSWMARQLEQRRHLPRVGDQISDDCGELYHVTKVCHNLEEAGPDVTIWIGSQQPYLSVN